jgi:ABC-type hemin transport system ATPase subunit
VQRAVRLLERDHRRLHPGDLADQRAQPGQVATSTPGKTAPRASDCSAEARSSRYSATFQPPSVIRFGECTALERFADRAPVAAALRPVSDVGLGYLRLGEPTPSLSGGESQRLRIASRLRSSQRGTLYVFDEPSTGLHPLDVATLAGVFDRLLDAGATIIVIDHDLDLLAAADHLIDMGPGGGPDGGHILAAGAPADIARDPGSATGPWLAEHLSPAVRPLTTGTGAR